ncbi:MAG TPA: DEAD/DEAH box helicase [Acidimicrobiia bacterium]|nr:DEAD/DEAH box helicase [Acidimicrobiia bacterium]
MDAIEALEKLAADPELGERLTRLEVAPARPARYGDPERPLHPEVLERLAARGAERLYVHQAEAIDRLRAGRSVALATGTGSGKSLCYQAPIAESILSGGKDTALLLFPTKALAHDQLRRLRSWLVPGMRAVAYDGDTPVEERASLRRTANVVLTNPEMLHTGILPYHDRWATFLMRLRYVVVDELHTLRGIFGSHVAHLLHRLRRVCLRYGAEPAFCFASATIGNPAALAAELCGLPVDAVDDDGSPRGPRAVALLDRPMVDPAKGRRASATAEVGGLLAYMVGRGLRTIAFSPSRRSAELVARQARHRLEGGFGAPLAEAVAAYRGGYLPEERRQLETALSKGELLGVAATNALELGIDVAGLDAVVLQGFPGTLASFWQQAGRAGRALQPSAAILVAGDDQLDRWYLDHPTELFTRPLEPAVINPKNPFVAQPHVGCAAFELPLSPDDPVLSGDPVDDAVRELVLADALKPRAGKMYWARPEAPAPHVGLRTGSSVEYRLYEEESGRLVGTVDSARVFHIAHPGAIYLHQGRQYRVEHLDLADAYALLAAVEVDEYTQPRHDIDIAITGEERSRPVGRSTLHLGAVEVTTTTDAYQRRRIGSGEVLDTVELDLPPRTLSTRAGWYTVPVEVVLGAGLDAVTVLSAAHAAEHALIGMLPLFAICDRWDVGGVSMAVHPATGEPTIFIYDGYPGGAGIAELAFEAADRHLAAACDVVAACACEAGCPSCVQSPKCGNWNEFLDKRAAATLMRAMLSGGAGG